MKTNNFLLFVILYTLTLSGTVFSKELLDSNQLLYNSLAERLTTDQIAIILDQVRSWEWIAYLAMPLFLYIKISLISIVLFIGIFLSESKIQFKQLFQIVIKAEFIFLLALCFKTIKFYLFERDYSITDLTNYMPLSLESLFGYKNFEVWYIYPMQTANLFEVAYWIILIALLSKALQLPKNRTFMIVASSYGASLLLWVLGIVFITISLN